jgi:phosphate transport system protein
MREHTDRDYEAELGELRKAFMRMGLEVEDMIAGAMKALIERDSELAKQIYQADHQINLLEVDIDERCIRILARRQPVASDLRFIATALKSNTDLERIGDMVANICDRVIELNQEPPIRSYDTLQLMGAAAAGMVHDALAAFVARDADRAEQLLGRDRAVDDYYGQLFEELLHDMMADPKNVYRATRLQSIAKYLERIADHATNLAEMVVFLVKGKDIRHPYSRTVAKPPPR